MAESKYREELLDANIKYIDPLDCGSTVGYRIFLKGNQGEGKVSAEVDIADCGRTVSWSFYGDDIMEKIDNALELLTSFRNKLEREMNKKRGK